MPGRFFEISANPVTATVAPGGTVQLTYTVTNKMGRPVSAEFVIVPPSPTEGNWAKVSNGALRQFTLDGSQDFVVTVNPATTTPVEPAGPGHQFAVYVKATENPATTFDQGPPFTITVKGTPKPTNGPRPPWWKKFVIPGAIAGALVLGLVLFFIFKPGPKTFPNLRGMPLTKAINAVGDLDVFIGAKSVPTTSTSDSGLVTDQKPDSGAKVTAGDTLTLTFKQYQPPTGPPCRGIRCLPVELEAHNSAVMSRVAAAKTKVGP